MSRKNKPASKKARREKRARGKSSQADQERAIREFIHSNADEFAKAHDASEEERKAFIRATIAEGCLPDGLSKLVSGAVKFDRLSPFAFLVEEDGEKRFPGNLLPPWSEFVETSLDVPEEFHALRRGVRGELADSPPERFFNNSRMSVILTEVKSGWTDTDGEPIPLSYLAIKYHDRSARHDWRDFQRVKNEILGEEVEAIELFPAESRLVDSANQFHLYALPEGMKIPFGMDSRSVCSGGTSTSLGGFMRQREFEEGHEPEDAISFDEMEKLMKEFVSRKSSEEGDESRSGVK